MGHANSMKKRKKGIGATLQTLKSFHWRFSHGHQHLPLFQPSISKLLVIHTIPTSVKVSRATYSATQEDCIEKKSLLCLSCATRKHQQ